MIGVIVRLALVVVVLQLVALALNVSQVAALLAATFGWFVGEVVHVKIRRK